MPLARLAALALAFASVLLLPTRGRAAAGTFTDLLASADALVAEQSWELARQRYTEALAAAPDAATRARCELLIEGAAWRSEATAQVRWRDGDRWQRRHLAAFDRLEAPYRDATSPRPRDDFWQSVLTSRARFEQFLQLPVAWTHYAAVADHLGAQPPSPQAARRYVEFLQQVLEPPPSDLPREFFTLRTHLIRGAQVGATPDDRAWCAWQLARVGEFRENRYENTFPHAADYAARWTAALAASANTRWAPLVSAEAFLWRTSSRYSPGLPPNTPADVPAILDELRETRRALVSELAPAAARIRTRLDRLERSLADPQLTLAISETFSPRTPIRFNYGASGLAQLAVTLDRVEPATWLALPDFWRFDSGHPATRPSALATLRDWKIPLPDSTRLAWSTQIVDLAPELPPGLYVLTVRGEKSDGSASVTTQRKFLVSSLRGFGVFSSATAGRLFAYRASDGQPVAHAPVTSPGPARFAPRPWHGTTDAHGTVELPPLDEQLRSFLALVEGEPVWFPNTATWRGEPRSLFIDVYTDRPLFRPGETAHWKLIVREHHDGRFTIPTDLAGLNLRIMLGDTALVAPAPLQLSATGTAHGEIALPADVRPGEARLQLFRGKTPERAVDSNTPLFRIDRFVPPAAVAALEFTGDARSFRPGREITARVTASYFSGGPLTHAPVRFTISSDDRYAQTSDEVSQWLASLAREPQSAVTDGLGQADTTLNLPAFLPEGFKLRLTADLTPEGALPLAAHATVTLTASGLTLDPLGWTSPRLVSPDDTVSFAAVVRDGRGTPVSLDVRAQLVELRWSEVWLDAKGAVVPVDQLADLLAQSEPGRDFPADWQLIHAAYTETVAAETAVHTAADGRVAATFKLPHAGVYRLRVSADAEITATASRDFSRSTLIHSWRSSRRPARINNDDRLESLSLVAADERTGSLALNPETAALIAPADFSPGQPLRVLAVAPAGATQAWISVAGENAVIAERSPLQRRLAWHTFTQLPSLLGEAKLQFTFRYAHLSPNLRVQTSVRTAPASQLLNLTVAPDATASRPGQPAQLVVTARNAAGQPVPAAELAVRVADEAVNSLLSDDAAEPPPSFSSLRRTVNAQLVLSREMERELVPIVDPRNGAIRNPTTPFYEDSGLTGAMPLAAFAVASEGRSDGYTASSASSGARLRTTLGDSASALSVVTAPSLDYYHDTPPPPVEVRSHFSSTAFWSPDLVTDAHGEARVTFTYPDNLTRWRLGAYALGADGSTFGTAAAFTQTSLPFQARLQLPRFLVAGDTASPSATLVNRTDADLRATATLALSGPLTAEKKSTLTRADLLVPQQAESHTVWSLHATAPGTAELKLTARAGAESDAMSLPLPILEDGLQQHTAAFARLTPDAAHADFTLELPATLDPARTAVSLQFSPSYTTTLLDALPYLVDYPYGCVEQTMSRFLPAVVVRKTLTDLGLDAEAVERRILARETAADRARRERTAGFAHLDDVVAQSLSRLREAQTDQGFGWWPGANSPDLWMTAYVAWGLSLAADAGIEIPDHLDTRTTLALINLVRAADLSASDDGVAFAWAALARARDTVLLTRPGTLPPLFAKTFAARARLSASGRACLALAAKTFGTPDQRATLLRNLDNGVARSTAAGLGDTAHWGATHGYWRAMDSAVESTALTLLALLELDPSSKLIEPAATWLALERRTAHWSNTRATAFAVLSLNRFLRTRGQLDATAEIELLANGRSLRRLPFSQATLLEPSTIAVPIALLHGGKNTFTLRRLSGTAPVLAAALSSSWARGHDVKPLGHLIDVARVFDRQKTEPTLIGTLRLSTEPLDANHTALAGDEVTARLTLTIPNELEYVMIAVPKPAGCEPLNPLSGWDARLVRIDPDAPDRVPHLPAPATPPASASASARLASRRLLPPQPDPDGRPLYREEHDDRSVFFLDHVDAGTWDLRFRLRAVTLGDFRALPAVAEAMYAPEITANSDARRIRIGPVP